MCQTTMTPSHALRGVLLANHALADEVIGQDTYDGINATFVAAVGQPAADRLAEICTGEKWSPQDMAGVAENADALALLLDRITEPVGIPAELRDEVEVLAEAYGGVRVERRESDLPGFDYFEMFGWHESDADPDDPEQIDGEDVRIGGRLVLTLTGGRGVTLDEQETADVMWALANATRRNRKAKAHGNNPDRAERFDRQVAVMQKIAGE